jgi:hypothetical protein
MPRRPRIIAERRDASHGARGHAPNRRDFIARLAAINVLVRRRRSSNGSQNETCAVTFPTQFLTARQV